MASQDRQLGHATLGLLAEDWTVPILRELQDGPLRPTELEQRIPDAPHAALIRRLSDMHDRGILTRDRYPDLPPRTQYAMTRPGRQILDVLVAAKRWERQWASESRNGLSALRLVGDERTREIVLVLAEAPASASDLQRRLPTLMARSTLRQRIADLTRRGILARHHDGGTVDYELTDSARGLAVVAIAAARWEWQWDRPDEPVAARKVASVLHLFAPAARVLPELGGVCRLRVAAPGDERDIYLEAESGAVRALSTAPADPPHADSEASPHQWCDALLLRRPCGITTTGNVGLMAATIASVTAAMFA
jgi:DNA-binding HxlR family transcriptional regulator